MKLINTSVFQLSIKIAFYFAFLTISSMLYVYYVTLHEIDRRVDGQLMSELHYIETYYNNNGYDALVTMMTQQDYFGHPLHHHYSLIGKDNNFITGSLFLGKNRALNFVEKSGVFYADIVEKGYGDEKQVTIRLGKIVLDDGLQVVAAIEQNEQGDLYAHTLEALSTSIIVTIIFATFLGYYLGNSVLKRVQRIDRGLQTAIDSKFNYQLEMPDKLDEFHAITSNLNFTLSRVSDLIKGMREITDNIAHDMRSPLTRIRSRIEVTLLQKRSESEYLDVLEKTNDDCEALLDTFNELLTIARTESGISRGEDKLVDLVEIADEVVELYEATAEDKNIKIHWEKPASVMLLCQPKLLGQAASNLLENAVKYTQEAGRVDLKVSYVDHRPSIIVADNGPGIPEEDRQRVLQRFQRLDQSRSLPGNGLGLSMVNAIAKMYQAELIMEDNNPGLIIELRFPPSDELK